MRRTCVEGCDVYTNVVQSPPVFSLPTPLLSLGLTEASTALERDPGIYRIHYNLKEQKNLAMTDVTSNFTGFIFYVQNGTGSHYYFKVSMTLKVRCNYNCVFLMNQD